MKNWKKPLMTVAAASSLLLVNAPTFKVAAQVNKEVAQGTGAAVQDGTNYFGDMDPNTTLSIDFVLKLQNKDDLERYIKETVTPYSPHYRKYLSVDEFKAKYAPNPAYIHSVTSYLQSYGIKTDVHANNLTITATGTVAQLNKALSVNLKYASFKGKSIHATKKNPTLPKASLAVSSAR